MFGLGIPELIVIFVIALLVFGPKKLPDLGKSIGRAMSEFKKAQQEFQESVQAEMKEVKKNANLEEFKDLAKIDALSSKDTPARQETEQKPDSASEQKKQPSKDEGTKANG